MYDDDDDEKARHALGPRDGEEDAGPGMSMEPWEGSHRGVVRLRCAVVRDIRRREVSATTSLPAATPLTPASPDLGTPQTPSASRGDALLVVGRSDCCGSSSCNGGGAVALPAPPGADCRAPGSLLLGEHIPRRGCLGLSPVFVAHQRRAPHTH